MFVFAPTNRRLLTRIVLNPTPKITWSRREISVSPLIGWASSLPNVLLAEDVILAVHSHATGCWTVDIFAATALSRIFISGFFMTSSRRIFATYALRCGESLKRQNRMVEETKQKAYAGKEASILLRQYRISQRAKEREERKNIILKYNIHPLKGWIYMIAEATYWFSITVAIRNISAGFPVDIASEASSQMSQEGFLWFSSLTQPDPLWIFPLISATSLLISSRYMKEWRRQNDIPEVLIYRILSFLPIPFSAWILWIGGYLPVSVTLFWATSSLIGFIQAIVFTYPRVQKLLSIPTTGRPVNVSHWLQMHGFRTKTTRDKL